MAERRMFAKSIIDSDAFLEMPMSARLLYYDLGMRADDEGFVNSPKKIMKMIGASTDDLNILIFRRFVLAFESGVLVIKQWRINNYLRSDRFHETNYINERSQLTIDSVGNYHLKKDVGIPGGTPTVYPDKDSIGEVSIGEDKKESEIPMSPEPATEASDRINYQEIVDAYHVACPDLPKVMALSEKRKKAIKARVKQYGLEKILDAFNKAGASSFLKGGNRSDWSADFDWLMRDGNIPKVLEGKYDDRPGQTAGGPRPKGADELDASYRMMAEWAREEA